MSAAHSLPVSLRDPAARGRVTALLLACIVLWPLLVVAEFKPGSLFDAQNLKVTGNFLAAFLPPETGHECASSARLTSSSSP
mgnify:CR=1 FL=1